jgi:hypothetical protein
MSVHRTGNIVPLKGLISGEPEVIPEGYLTEAENVVIHPTQGIRTRPAMYPNGYFQLHDDIKYVFFSKPFEYLGSPYLFVLGGDNQNPDATTKLIIAVMSLLNGSLTVMHSLDKTTHASYFNYLYDYSKGEDGLKIIEEEEKVALAVIEDKLWIINRTLKTAMPMPGPVFKLKVKDIKGNMPNIVVYKNGVPNLIPRTTLDYTSKDNLAFSLISSIQSLGIEFNGGSVTANGTGDYELTVTSPAETPIDIVQNKIDNPWYISGEFPESSGTHMFTMNFKEFPDTTFGFEDKLRLRVQRINEDATTTEILTDEFQAKVGTPIKAGDIIIGWVDSIGNTLNSRRALSLKIKNQYYVTHVGWNDRDSILVIVVFIPIKIGFDDDNIIYNWEATMDGQLLASKSGQYKLKDNDLFINDFTSIEAPNYILNSQKTKQITIRYNTLSGNYHSAPYLKTQLNIGDSIRVPWEGFADDSGVNLISMTEALDAVVDKLNTLYSKYNLTAVRDGNTVKVTYPYSLDFTIEIEMPTKQLTIENLTKTTYKFEDSSTPFLVNMNYNDTFYRPLTLTSSFDYATSSYTQLPPTFAKRTIKDIAYAQGRVVLLSDAGVTFSKLNNPELFTIDASETPSDTSAIDALFSQSGDILEYIVPIENDMYVFGQNYQYVIHFDGYISPYKILIKTATNYKLYKERPTKAGNELFFASKITFDKMTPYKVALFNFYVQPNVLNTEAVNKSLWVYEFMPAEIKQLITTDNGGKIIMVGDDINNGKLYILHRFKDGQNTLIESWSIWNYPIEFDVLAVTADNKLIAATIAQANGKYYLLTHVIPVNSLNTIAPQIDTYYDKDNITSKIEVPVNSRIAFPISTNEIPLHLRARLDTVYISFDNAFRGYAYYRQDGKITPLGAFLAQPYAAIGVRQPARGGEIILTTADPNNTPENKPTPLNFMGYSLEYRIFNRKYGKY